MEIEIYIKGCEDAKRSCASCAFVIRSVNGDFWKRAIRFEDNIGKNGATPIIPNKGQFQMELYALAWALSLVKDADAEFKVYSNNTAVVGWINKWDVPDDYVDMFNVCDALLMGRAIKSEHIPKKSEKEENRKVNEAAEYLLGLSGDKTTYVF